MNTILWQARVTSVGAGVAEFVDAGVLVLFGEPVPDALAEVSVVHADATGSPELRAGDELWVGSSCARIAEVGAMANANFSELGHIVIYYDAGGTELLPGAVRASGSVALPSVGDVVALRRGEE